MFRRILYFCSIILFFACQPSDNSLVIENDSSIHSGNHYSSFGESFKRNLKNKCYFMPGYEAQITSSFIDQFLENPKTYLQDKCFINGVGPILQSVLSREHVIKYLKTIDEFDPNKIDNFASVFKQIDEISFDESCINESNNIRYKQYTDLFLITINLKESVDNGIPYCQDAVLSSIGSI
jgi:hypothetical protein